MWQDWVNGILGLWVILTPFMFTVETLTGVLVVTGIVIAVLGFWSAVGRKGEKGAGGVGV